MAVRTEKKITGRDPMWQVNGIPNSVFAKTDDGFKKKCETAGVQPTRRQASKYRRKFGSAYAA